MWQQMKEQEMPTSCHPAAPGLIVHRRENARPSACSIVCKVQDWTPPEWQSREAWVKNGACFMEQNVPWGCK